LRDRRVDVVLAGLIALAVDDLAAELLEALLERLDDVLEVDEQRVRAETRGLPAAAPRVLRHRRALFLGPLAEGEGELALLAEALRAHLVGADARRDRELPALDRLLHDRGREVDVARREQDLRSLAEQVQGARLRPGGVVVLRVAGLDHELAAEHTALRVDLLDPDPRGRQRRI